MVTPVTVRSVAPLMLKTCTGEFLIVRPVMLDEIKLCA